MGKNFNFLTWCDEWLKTSGVNLLEPIVEYNKDRSIKRLRIKQTASKIGHNILRQHKLNIALFDD
jgi:hypothetical protein